MSNIERKGSADGKDAGGKTLVSLAAMAWLDDYVKVRLRGFRPEASPNEPSGLAR